MKSNRREEQSEAAPPLVAYLQYAASRDMGRHKQANEDNTFALTCQLPSQTGGAAELPFGLFILADGVTTGGGGELASATAVQHVAAAAIKHLLLPLISVEEASAAGGAINDILADAVSAANAAIHALGNVAEGVNAPGSTVVAALVLGQRLYVAHVGDSRLYLLGKDGKLRQLTQDHSMVARLVEMGQMTAAEAEHSDQRSVLYRALGQAATVEVDTYSATLGDYSRLLLCSDGLWGMVSDADIAASLGEQTHPATTAQQLVAAANAGGGEDNISVIVVALD